MSIPTGVRKVDNNAYYASSYRIWLPSTSDDFVRIMMFGLGQAALLNWRLLDMCYRDSSGNYDYIIGAASTVCEINGYEAVFRRIFPNVDDVLKMCDDKVKHDIVLYSAPRQPASYLSEKIEFGISLFLKGAKFPIGRYNTIDKSPIHFGELVVRDARGMEVNGYYEVVDADDGQRLFMWIPADFLFEAEYPVVVDPTVIANVSFMEVFGLPSSRKIVVDSRKNIYAALRLAYPPDVGFYVSSDIGNTWQNIPIPMEMDWADPALCIDRNDVIHLAWVDSGGSGIGVWYGQYDTNSDTWNNIQLIASDPNGIIDPSIDIDPQGNIHVAYGKGFSTEAIYYRRRNSNGTWTSETKLPQPTSTTVLNVCITAYSQSNVHVVWTSDASGQTNYNIRHTMYNGSSWSSYYNVTSSSYYQYWPCAVVDKSGNLHVVWTGRVSGTDNYEYVQYRRRSSGGSWDAIQTISLSVGWAIFAAIGVDEKNNLHVAWAFDDNAFDNMYIQYRPYLTSWGSWHNVVSIGGHVLEPDAFYRSPNITDRERSGIIALGYSNESTRTALFHLVVNNLVTARMNLQITINSPSVAVGPASRVPNTLNLSSAFQAVSKLVRTRTVTPNTLEISVSSPQDHRFYVPNKINIEAEVVPQGGTLASSATYLPYYTYYHDTRFQYVLLASELLAAGFQPGDKLTSMKFRVGSSLPGMNLANFRIRLQNTDRTTSTSWVTTNWTLVYGPTTIPLSSFTSTGQWYEHKFNTPFVWDGRNLLIDVSKDGSSWANGGSNYVYSGITNRACGMQSDSGHSWPYDSATANAVNSILQTRIIVTREKNPTPPTDLSCSDGSWQPRLTWTINETGATQIKFQVQIERYDTETSSWELHHDSGEVASSDQYYDVPASARLESNTQYRFRVMVWLSTGWTTPWSDYFEWTPNYVEPNVASIDMTLEVATLILDVLEPSTLEAVLEAYSPELQVGPVSLSPDTLEVATEFVTPSRVQCDYTAQLDELVLDTSIHGVDDLIKGPVSVEPLPLQSTITANKVLRAMHRIVRLKIYKDSKLLNEVDSHAGT